MELINRDESQTLGYENELPDFDFQVEEDSEIICSPIQGRVLEIAVESGQTVNKGEKVVTLESMKMEIIINSSIAGTVQSIHIHAGDFVKSNQEMLIITG